MEKNRDNLKKSLEDLPDYEPKGDLWGAIENNLSTSQSNKILSEGIAQLPEYTPSEGVWQAIAKDLNAEVKSAKIRKISPRRWAAAAAVLLLVGVFYFMVKGELEGTSSVEYAEEVVEDVLLERDWGSEDDDAFNEILALCEMQSYACTQPVFQSLKAELDELTSARDMLRAAIGEYGTEIELLQELKEVEMLRTDIIKQLAEQVA